MLSALVDSLYVESNVAAPSDEFTALRYQGQIIDKMISWYMDNFLAQFRDIISLIKRYNIACHSNWMQCMQRNFVIGRQADSEKIDRARRVLEGMTCEVQVEYNYTYQEASCFFTQFLVMWKYLGFPPLKHKNGVFAREEIPKIVQQIRKNVRPLADYLNRPELIAPPEVLSRALENYLIIAENPTTYMPHEKIISVIPPLLQGLFFAVICRHLCDPDPFVKSFLKFKDM